MRIGVAGTGRMGAAIAGRLLRLGHEVTVWNRSAGKTRPLAAAGAKVAATAAQLAISSDIVLTIMSGAPRVLHHRAGDIAATLGGGNIEPVNLDIDSVRKDCASMPSIWSRRAE